MTVSARSIAAASTADAFDRAQVNQPIRYQSKWQHQSGLINFGFRFYNPGTARWMSRDPLGEAGGLNLYGYVGGDPINRFDPDGMDWLDTASNFSAGWGDALTFGGTKYVRKYGGEWSGIGDTNEVVDYCSGAYFGGQVVGTVHQTLLLSGVGGAGARAAKGAESLNSSNALFVTDRQLAKSGIRALYDDFIANGGVLKVSRGVTARGPAGEQVFGAYKSTTNTVTLYKGSNLGTIGEELSHFDQVKKLGLIGKRISPAQISVMERQVISKLSDIGIFKP